MALSGSHNIGWASVADGAGAGDYDTWNLWKVAVNSETLDGAYTVNVRKSNNTDGRDFSEALIMPNITGGAFAFRIVGNYGSQVGGDQSYVTGSAVNQTQWTSGSFSNCVISNLRWSGGTVRSFRKTIGTVWFSQCTFDTTGTGEALDSTGLTHLVYCTFFSDGRACNLQGLSSSVAHCLFVSSGGVALDGPYHGTMYKCICRGFTYGQGGTNTGVTSLIGNTIVGGTHAYEDPTPQWSGTRMGLVDDNIFWSIANPTEVAPGVALAAWLPVEIAVSVANELIDPDFAGGLTINPADSVPSVTSRVRGLNQSTYTDTIYGTTKQRIDRGYPNDISANNVLTTHTGGIWVKGNKIYMLITHDFGEGGTSEVAELDLSAPSIPTSLTITASANGRAWVIAATGDPGSTIVLRNPSAQDVAVIDADVGTNTVTNLTAGVSYTPYAVQDGKSDSAAGTAATAPTLANSLTLTGGELAYLRKGTSTSAFFNYRPHASFSAGVVIAQASDGTRVQQAITSGGTFELTGLADGRYLIWVTAFNADETEAAVSNPVIYDHLLLSTEDIFKIEFRTDTNPVYVGGEYQGDTARERIVTNVTCHHLQWRLTSIAQNQRIVQRSLHFESRMQGKAMEASQE